MNNMASTKRRLEKLPDPDSQERITSIVRVVVEAYEEDGVRKVSPVRQIYEKPVPL